MAFDGTTRSSGTLSARQPLREIVDLGLLVDLDRAAVDVDDVEAAKGHFSSDLRAMA